VYVKGTNTTLLSQRLKKLRQDKGITQRQLALESGVGYGSIVDYENGRREPNSKAMAALERYFNVSGEYLRGETDQRDLMKWDDPEIIEAVRESLPAQISRLNGILKDCTDQDQKMTFDILT